MGIVYFCFSLDDFDIWGRKSWGLGIFFFFFMEARGFFIVVFSYGIFRVIRFFI